MDRGSFQIIFSIKLISKGSLALMLALLTARSHALAQTAYSFVREGFQEESREFNAPFEVVNDSFYVFYTTTSGSKWDIVLAKGAIDDLRISDRTTFTNDTLITSIGWYESTLYDPLNDAIVLGFSAWNTDSVELYNLDAGVASFNASTFEKNYVKFSKKFGRDFPSSAMIDVEGNYLFCGFSKQLDTASLGGMFLTKTTSEGDTLWDHAYVTQGRENALSVSNGPDGGYYLFGRSDGHVTEPPYASDSKLYRLDRNGNVIWQKTFGGRYSDCNWGVQYQEGVGVLTMGCFANNNVNEGITQGYIRLLDENGDEIWSYLVPTEDSYEVGARFFFGGRLLEDGSAIIFGAGYYDDGKTQISDVPYIYFISPEGELEYKRAYTSWYDDARRIWPQDIHVFESGEILLSGTYYPNDQDTGSQDIFFAVLDSAGCEYPGCRPPLSTENTSTFSRALKVYPNPASTEINVQIPSTIEHQSIELFNMVGQSIYASKIEGGKHVVDITHLKVGVYLLQVSDGSTASRRRIVVSR